MAYNYASSQATADRLIAHFGQAGVIRRTTSTGDAWNPTQTSTDYDCTLVVLDYSTTEKNGTLIQAKDRKVLIATDGLTIEPTDADKLVIGSAVYSIVSVKPLSPAETVILYEVQACI